MERENIGQTREDILTQYHSFIGDKIQLDPPLAPGKMTRTGDGVFLKTEFPGYYRETYVPLEPPKTKSIHRAKVDTGTYHAEIDFGGTGPISMYRYLSRIDPHLEIVTREEVKLEYRPNGFLNRIILETYEDGVIKVSPIDSDKKPKDQVKEAFSYACKHRGDLATTIHVAVNDFWKIFYRGKKKPDYPDQEKEALGFINVYLEEVSGSEGMMRFIEGTHIARALAALARNKANKIGSSTNFSEILWAQGGEFLENWMQEYVFPKINLHYQMQQRDTEHFIWDADRMLLLRKERSERREHERYVPVANNTWVSESHRNGRAITVQVKGGEVVVDIANTYATQPGFHSVRYISQEELTYAQMERFRKVMFGLNSTPEKIAALFSSIFRDVGSSIGALGINRRLRVIVG